MSEKSERRKREESEKRARSNYPNQRRHAKMHEAPKTGAIEQSINDSSSK